MYEDKYKMTIEQNIFVAKRNIVDYIWKSAKLEGLSVTYPQTDVIFNGMSAQGVPVNDIIIINNLKHAWDLVLSTTDYETDLRLACQINKLIGGENLVFNAGYVRLVDVKIGGTTWKPELPDEYKCKEDIEKILSNNSSTHTERAIDLTLYLMRGQLFHDGNKRTAMLLANHYMITHGVGIVSIPIEKLEDFKHLLVGFYETGNTKEMKDFIYNECIDGIDF